MSNPPKVPYDNDPRPLKPANTNLKEVREHEGPNPTQDGPYHGTSPDVDDMGYLGGLKGDMYSYLGHFRGDKELEEGHNTVPVAGRGPASRPSAPARSQGPVRGTSRPVAGKY